MKSWKRHYRIPFLVFKQKIDKSGPMAQKIYRSCGMNQAPNDEGLTMTSYFAYGP